MIAARRQVHRDRGFGAGIFDRIDAGTANIAVISCTVATDNEVITGAGIHIVVARTRFDFVAGIAADNRVIAFAAHNVLDGNQGIDAVANSLTGRKIDIQVGIDTGVIRQIVAGSPAQPVIARPTGKRVGTGSSIHEIIARSTVQCVVAGAAVEQVVALPAVEHIVSAGSIEMVGFVASLKRFGSLVADDLHAADHHIHGLIRKLQFIHVDDRIDAVRADIILNGKRIVRYLDNRVVGIVARIDRDVFAVAAVEAVVARSPFERIVPFAPDKPVCFGPGEERIGALATGIINRTGRDG